MSARRGALVLVLVAAAFLDGVAFGGDAGPALADLRARLVAIRNAQAPPRGAAARRERAAVVQSIRRLRGPSRHLGDDLLVARAVFRRLERGFPAGIDAGSNLGARLAAVRAELAVCVADVIATIDRIATSETDDAARAAVLTELDLARSSLAEANAAASPLAAAELLIAADAHNAAAVDRLQPVAGDLTFLLDSVPFGASEGSSRGARSAGHGFVQVGWHGPDVGVGTFQSLSIILSKPDAGARKALAVYSKQAGDGYSRGWIDTDAPVTVTLHDPRLRLISGTFEFVLDAQNPPGIPVTVEQGSFALRYQE